VFTQLGARCEFLVNAYGKEMSLRNILIGVFFTATTAFILKKRATILVKKVALN